MQEKLTIRDLCTIKVLCKDELAKLYEDDALNSEWAERVQELSDVARELLRKTPKVKEITRVAIAKEEDMDLEVAKIGKTIERCADDEVQFIILTPYWEQIRWALSGLGYAFSSDNNGIEHKVTFYKGGAKL